MVQAIHEEFTLFDFDFQPVTFAEVEIQEGFALLVQRIKEKGNYYTLNGVYTKDIEKFFPVFQERGWTDKKNNVRRDLIDYHSAEEVINNIEEYVDELMNRIDNGEVINWHNDTWRFWDKFIPCDLDKERNLSQKKRELIYFQTRRFKKQIALKLGLKHFLENPESRGSEMHAFESKGYKKYLIPYLENEVAAIKEFDEMQEFFAGYFFAGRRDEIWNLKNHKIAPYPVFVQICLNELHIAALCETDESNVKEVLKLVLKHVGQCSSSIENVKAKYSPNFTYSDYLDSLSDEDILLIFKDIERLNAR